MLTDLLFLHKYLLPKLECELGWCHRGYRKKEVHWLLKKSDNDGYVTSYCRDCATFGDNDDDDDDDFDRNYNDVYREDNADYDDGDDDNRGKGDNNDDSAWQ